MLTRIIHAAIVFGFIGYYSGDLKITGKYAAILKVPNPSDYLLSQGAIE